MKALMVHQCISGEVSKVEMNTIEDKKVLYEIQSKAHNALILSLRDDMSLNKLQL